MAEPYQGREVAVLSHCEFSSESLTSQLESLGMTVHATNQLGQLESMFSGLSKCHFIVVDIGFEGKSNEAIVDDIRTAAKLENLPVVFMGPLGSMHLGSLEDRNVFSLVKPFKLVNVRKLTLETVGQGKPAAKVVPKKSVTMGEMMPLRVLLAEDNAVNQKVAVRLFKKIGYHIELAHNGLEAVNMIAKERYDIIFMDIQMPEMDGIEATREIIRRFGQTRPRIIALTANAMREDRENCFAAGMDGYLTKPFKQEDLKDALSQTYRRIIAPSRSST